MKIRRVLRRDLPRVLHHNRQSRSDRHSRASRSKAWVSRSHRDSHSDPCSKAWDSHRVNHRVNHSDPCSRG